ncbi:hypothetical protein MUK70_05710 [Dyadobacter chenwenxiniae]|uniref:Uncharacterized protein n=1 Tax=Dyadobacter chenwenxiniae TaxID=2906456 RepID=A0A9X1TP66_9BACT|nr:hypothetical protein [Dyadobacter chenwenxiniae]MCF0065248.1 hypothetical protein [Dyadobacter chenwenxiniae]UON84482.1 hypothetical protein MUK70_05710 [Dyadobacter chenwenxiniae]
MEAVLRVSASEFTDELVNKIRMLLSGAENSEITISITEIPSSGILRNETRDEYFSRLEKSLDNLEKGNVISFNGDTFDQFARHLSIG